MNTAFQHTNNTDHHAAHTMTNSSTVSPPSIAAPTEAREAKKGSLAAFKGLLPFLRPYLKQFIMAGIALVVAACATLAIPAAFKQMIDLGFGGTGAKSIKHVDLVFLALFGVATVLALAMAARFYRVVAGRARDGRHPHRRLSARRHAKPRILRDHADRRSPVAHHHRHDADPVRRRHQHLDGAA